MSLSEKYIPDKIFNIFNHPALEQILIGSWKIAIII